MLETIDSESLEGMFRALNIISVLKYLSENGYKTTEEYYNLGTFEEDPYNVQTEYLKEVIKLICTEDYWSYEEACEESGELLGYRLSDENGEEYPGTINELVITLPVIVEYLKWVKECNLKTEESNDFFRLIRHLQDCFESAEECELTDVFVSKNYDSIVIVFGFCYYDLFEIAVTLVSIVDFCTREIKRKKEGEFIYGKNT